MDHGWTLGPVFDYGAPRRPLVDLCSYPWTMAGPMGQYFDSGAPRRPLGDVWSCAWTLGASYIFSGHRGGPWWMYVPVHGPWVPVIFFHGTQEAPGVCIVPPVDHGWTQGPVL
jgi:hypothetical protein